MELKNNFEKANKKGRAKQVGKMLAVGGATVGSALGGAAAGAAVGGAFGSVVPIVGTVIGAAVGGIFGAVLAGAAGFKVAKMGVEINPIRVIRQIKTDAFKLKERFNRRRKKSSFSKAKKRIAQLTGSVLGVIVFGTAGALAGIPGGPIGIIAGALVGAELGVYAGAKFYKKHMDKQKVADKLGMEREEVKALYNLLDKKIKCCQKQEGEKKALFRGLKELLKAMNMRGYMAF